MSQTYKLRGRVAAILPPVVTKSGFTVQTLLLDDDSNPRYPQRVPVEFGGDRIALLASLAQGQDAEVTFSVSGREYNGRHFVSLRGLGVSVVAPAAVPTVAPIAPPPPAKLPDIATDPAAEPGHPETVEDLPF